MSPAATKTVGKLASLRRNVRRLMSRLSPDSLLSRLVLIFSGSFFILILLTNIYMGESRHFYYMRSLMVERARHIAESAVLLDASSPEMRFMLRDHFNSRGYMVHFSPIRPALLLQNEEFAEISDFMQFMLNSWLSRLYDGVPRNGVQGMKGEVPRRAVVVVNDLNLPSPMEAFWQSVKQYFFSKPKRNKGPSVYKATAVMALHDGTWMVIEDSSPGYPSMPLFSFSTIISIELFFVIISFLAFWLCIKPLRRLARAADRFGRDIPGTPPLPLTGPSEVREAAQAFNRMQKSIREFLEEREHTLAAVSHDLRTPLTRLRLRVEQLDDAQRIPLQKDIGELQQIMDTTIDIARSKSEAEVMVDIASLVESLVEDRRDMGQDISLAPRLEDPELLFGIRPIMARPLSLKRCLANLMDNGLRYGGRVEVDVEDGDEMLSVIISDCGPGIPEAELEKVFKPFYRGEPSRSRSTGGTGLGLAIARSMARLHDGDVTLHNRPEGGLVATASFRRK